MRPVLVGTCAATSVVIDKVFFVRYIDDEFVILAAISGSVRSIISFSSIAEVLRPTISARTGQQAGGAWARVGGMQVAPPLSRCGRPGPGRAGGTVHDARRRGLRSMPMGLGRGACVTACHSDRLRARVL